MPTSPQSRDRLAAGRISDRFWVLGLGLVTRLLVLWSVLASHGARWLFGRGLEIGFLARSLNTGHGFASPFGGDTGPTALVAPGYPLLIAAVFRVFGIESTASAVIIMLGQIASSLLTVWLMMHLAEKLFSRRAAITAGIFWACWPPLLWIPSIFWETSLSLTLLLGILALALRIREQPAMRLWLYFGVLCGITVLINMALLITSLAVFVWLASQTWQTSRAGILFASGLILLLYSPWPLRNAHTFGAFVPLRTTVGLELWMGNHEGSTGFLEESMFPIYNQVELNAYMTRGELAYDQDKSLLARNWIATHPSAFAQLTAKRLLRFWIGTGTRNAPKVYAVGAITTTVGGFIGLLLLYRQKRRSLALLFSSPLLLFPLPYYITHAEFRYRLVLDPLLTILSAYALTSFTGENTSTRSLDTGTPQLEQQATLG